jgi:hypothetical protein
MQAMQARSRLGGKALGDEIWAVTQAKAGKQQHELLLVHAGSEGSCRKLCVRMYVGDLSAGEYATSLLLDERRYLLRAYATLGVAGLSRL